MGRKRKSRIPKLSVNNKTIFNIFGFFFVAIGLMMLTSFIQIFYKGPLEGKVLKEVNQQLFSLFGGLSILSPFVVILLSGHFFNSKKLRLVKFNVSIGSLVLFISLVGLFRMGKVGESIFDN